MCVHYVLSLNYHCTCNACSCGTTLKMTTHGRIFWGPPLSSLCRGRGPTDLPMPVAVETIEQHPGGV